MALSAKSIEKISPPTTGRAVYSDPKFPLLRLRVTPTGSMSWLTRRKIDGKQINMTLGDARVMDIETANKAAMKAHATLLESGQSPKAQKTAAAAKAAAENVTLGEAVHAYLELKGVVVSQTDLDTYIRNKNRASKSALTKTLTASGNLKLSTAVDYVEDIKTTYGDWWGNPLLSITREKVAKRHRERSQSSKAAADRSARVLRAIMNAAKELFRHADDTVIFAENPVTILNTTKTWNPRIRRQTIIPKHKLSAWWAALDELAKERPHSMAPMARDFYQLLLLTGSRKEEVATLQ